jgi:glucose/mannose-6-phosphate isomerase
MPAPIVVEAQGEASLQQMLWTMLLGDFTSAYLACLNQVDPEPVAILDKLKKELAS